ncbi:uncharacterized protein LOC119082716 isoform X1 [Bradysia coprophila]|uniref:uncharacterized protein LOC119082716 isoform X1 n=1 Tax=Bradysia coprophila TaxID=38358 RepID=UPI00187DB598|nr:uncharacterized protein LOC119082716 isoform X1 [Bradysia coprophila]
MDNKIKEKFKKEILNENMISDAEIFKHVNEFYAASKEVFDTVDAILDDLDREFIEEMLDLERDIPHVEDEPDTIDHVMDLRAKFFKPTPREVIDARVAPMIANAPEPTITEREATEANYDDFWGDFFVGFDHEEDSSNRRAATGVVQSREDNALENTAVDYVHPIEGDGPVTSPSFSNIATSTRIVHASSVDVIDSNASVENMTTVEIDAVEGDGPVTSPSFSNIATSTRIVHASSVDVIDSNASVENMTTVEIDAVEGDGPVPSPSFSNIATSTRIVHASSVDVIDSNASVENMTTVEQIDAVEGDGPVPSPSSSNIATSTCIVHASSVDGIDCNASVESMSTVEIDAVESDGPVTSPSFLNILASTRNDRASSVYAIDSNSPVESTNAVEPINAIEGDGPPVTAAPVLDPIDSNPIDRTRQSDHTTGHVGRTDDDSDVFLNRVRRQRVITAITVATPDYNAESDIGLRLYTGRHIPVVVPIRTGPVPGVHAPDEHAPDEHIRDEHAPDEHAPDEHIRDEHAPDEHTPDEHIRDEHDRDINVSDEHICGEHVPDERIRDIHVLNEHVTVGSVPGGSVTGGSFPDGSVTGVSATDGSAPDGLAPNRSALGKSICDVHVSDVLIPAAAEPEVFQYYDFSDPTPVNAVQSSPENQKFDEILEAQRLIRDILNQVPTSQLFLRATTGHSSIAFSTFSNLWSFEILTVDPDEEDDERMTVSLVSG